MNSREDLFQNAPISKSVFQMAIPTVISSLVLVIYNMADTFFYWTAPCPLTGCYGISYKCRVCYVYGGAGNRKTMGTIRTMSTKTL